MTLLCYWLPNPLDFSQCNSQSEEIEFIRRIRQSGSMQPELITEDKNLQNVILAHPAIKWAIIRAGVR